jgi:hypothetical protein
MGLLLLVVYDVYATILHARARSGPISESLNRTAWLMARAIAFKLSRPHRHRFLNTIGPILLPLSIILFILMVLTGYALIYYPRMPGEFVFAMHDAENPLIEAFYFSGITLTTAGYGDIVPRTPGMRIAAMVESASGFALISLGITYLLTVYSALERKRAVALSFYHQAVEGADVAGLIEHHFVADRFYGLETTMRLATRDIQGLLESHVEHPVIHYFHPVEVYKSLPRMLFLILETCAVIQSCLDEEEYAEIRRHPVTRTLQASSWHVLSELVAALDLERRTKPRTEESLSEEERRWKRRFRQTIKRLDQAGIRTQPDIDAGWEEYRSRREEWESALHRFSSYLGYDWDEVTGDRDLNYAADEEMEEPHVRQR